jgi:hypothetical protein
MLLRSKTAFLSVVVAASLLLAGCIPPELLPGADVRKKEAEVKAGGEITGTVTGATPWEQVDSIIKIVNTARTPEESAMVHVVGLAYPANVSTPNRGLSIQVIYYIQVLSDPGRSPGLYDQAAAPIKNIQSFQRIVRALFELTFANMPVVRATVMIYWPDGVITSVSSSSGAYRQFKAGAIPWEEFVAAHSMQIQAGQLLSFAQELGQMGIDFGQFIQFSMQLYGEMLEQRRRQQQTPPTRP